MPAQANATITAVNAAGGSLEGDDWDRPAPNAGAAGASKWAGQARAYYRETTDRVAEAGSVNVLERRELILDTADVDAMALDTDDVVTFTVDGEDDLPARTGSATSIRRARLAGIPRGLATAKVILKAA